MAGEDLGVLGETGWLSEQSEEFREAIAARGRWRTVTRHSPLFVAAQPSEALYGLGEGTIELTLPLVGDEPVTFYRNEPGYWGGESCLLPGAVRQVSAVAARRSRIFVLAGKDLRRLLADRPEFWLQFFALSNSKTGHAVKLLAEALSLSPAARLARRLSRLADARGEVDISQSELAAIVGVTRITVQRALETLISEGAVETGYRVIRIVDEGAIRQIANQSER